MALQSLEAFRHTITVAWPRQMDEYARQTLIRRAREGNEAILRQQASRLGFRPEYEAYANKPGQTNISAVVLPGPIVFRYFYFREIAALGLQALRAASPKDSGDYVRSHMLFLNGSPVDVIPANLKRGDEVWIANPIAYARRLEIGRTKSGRTFVKQVANRIYENVAKRILIPRYRNAAKITFNYVLISGADSHTIKGGLPSRYGVRMPVRKGGGIYLRKRHQKVGTEVRSPAIIIQAL